MVPNEISRRVYTVFDYSVHIAGIVPFAIGSETVGSITYPASRCGVTALRPTFGAVGRTGVMSISESLVSYPQTLIPFICVLSITLEVLTLKSGWSSGQTRPPLQKCSRLRRCSRCHTGKGPRWSFIQGHHVGWSIFSWHYKTHCWISWRRW